MDGCAPSSRDYIAGEHASAWSPPFRGQIYDYARGLDLQQGYAKKGPFDIFSARHLIEPFEAIRDPSVRLVSVVAAIQTLKTLLGEITIPYWIEHDPGDILFLIGGDDNSKEMSESRLMPLIRSIPALARLLADIPRHDKTKTSIQFSHCNLIVAGLNLGNVQSKSYRYVIIDEAWMARANGLIRQAIDRTSQFADTKKVIILGQGGYQDEDADQIHRQTDMRELQWACPACGQYQNFELSRLRGEDHPVESLRGTYAGLSWDTNERTRADNRWNFEEVGKSAHLRCYHCDQRIDDTFTNRRALMESYRYVRTNPGAPLHSVGFHWPKEASTRIPLAELVVKYLRAKVAKEELSYGLPMQEFYQKDRGIHWADDLATEYRAVVQEPYNPRSAWPEEKYRVLIVDCQRDLQKFWYSVFAVALSGECHELARGGAGSFDDLAAIQKEHEVADQRCFLDCGFEMTRVLRECVKHGHVGTVRVGRELKHIWLCWTGLKGSGSEVFIHRHPKNKEITDRRIYSERKFYNVDIGTSGRNRRAPWYEWSNLHCKDLLRARRDGEKGIPRLLTLPDTLPETDPWSHFAQMRSERRVEKFAGGKKSAIWEQIKETRPNHFWDIAAMAMAFMAIVGVIGESSAVESPEETAPG